MVNFLFSLGLLFFTTSAQQRKPAIAHPIYVSVVEMEQNTAAKTVEISCKIFTDDFEKTLRKYTNVKVDLINPGNRAEMNNLVNTYLQAHFKLKINQQPAVLNFLGFEKIEEGIYSYFEVRQVNAIKNIEVYSTILYEYKWEQMGIFHCKANHLSKSSKLNNPDNKIIFNF